VGTGSTDGGLRVVGRGEGGVSRGPRTGPVASCDGRSQFPARAAAHGGLATTGPQARAPTPEAAAGPRPDRRPGRPAPSTVHLVNGRCRLNRLSHVDRATGEPPRRRSLFHLRRGRWMGVRQSDGNGSRSPTTSDPPIPDGTLAATQPPTDPSGGGCIIWWSMRGRRSPSRRGAVGSSRPARAWAGRAAPCRAVRRQRPPSRPRYRSTRRVSNSPPRWSPLQASLRAPSNAALLMGGRAGQPVDRSSPRSVTLGP
jgi:hypothetical protein